MRLLLCGGGTAGHITPAIAVAEELTKSNSQSKVLFIGRADGGENAAVEKTGFAIKTIKISGIKRKASLENARRVLRAINAISDAEKVIKEFSPDVVLGTGGYVCWPVIIAAKHLHIPIAIHESNVCPGLVTKLLARHCDIVFLGNEESKKYINKKAKTKVVGNPIREEFRNNTRSVSRAKLGIRENDFFILSFGGSLGAEKLNDTVMGMMRSYCAKDKDVVHIHSTGKRFYSEEKDFEQLRKNRCYVLPYIDNMPTLLTAADLVICRSGAMTLSELCAAGVPSILIPSPNVSNNHQLINARQLERKGAATVIKEENLTQTSLEKAVMITKNDKNGRKTRAKNAKACFCPNAASDMVKDLFLLKKANNLRNKSADA